MRNSFKQITRETISHWIDHDPGRAAASLSFYALFSLIPILVLIINFLTFFFSKSIIEGNTLHVLSNEFGVTIATFFQETLNKAVYSDSKAFSTISSIVALFLGALGIFSSLHDVLEDLWEEKDQAHNPKNFFKKILFLIKEKTALLSFLPVLGFFFLLFLIISFIIQKISVYSNLVFNIPSVLFTLFDPLVSIIFIIVIFAVSLRIFPQKKLPWKELVYGSTITAFLFVVGKVGINFYISQKSSLELYGGVADVAALFIWIYYSCQIFLLGASFTYIYSKRVGHIHEVKNNHK